MVTTVTVTVLTDTQTLPMHGWEVALCILAGGIALALFIWAGSKLFNG
jgi:hypothetical protein